MIGIRHRNSECEYLVTTVRIWTSLEALKDWRMNTYHKTAKERAVRSGAIMEDIITNLS